MTEPRTTARWGRVPAWWLLHPDVDADGFCVLAALATYADEHGMCVPSQATLAQRLQRSRPWVNRVVAQLAEAGLLEKTGRSRGNGGTTSCLYRLRLAQPDSVAREPGAASLPEPAPAAPDANLTGPVPQADTPCQPGDTSQHHLEHNNPPAPRAAPSRDSDAEVPADWEPSEADTAEALRLCPGADLRVHTARFRARCRARGYRYRAGNLGDAWLAWLLEDHSVSLRGEGRIQTGPRSAAEGHGRPQPSQTQRFAAWAAAASSPLSPAPSPWS